jgi:hypothetical protein
MTNRDQAKRQILSNFKSLIHEGKLAAELNNYFHTYCFNQNWDPVEAPTESMESLESEVLDIFDGDISH